MITLTDSISSILGVKVHNIHLDISQGCQIFYGNIAAPSLMRVELSFRSFKEIPEKDYGSVLLSSGTKDGNEYIYHAALLKGENTALIFKLLAELFAV